MGYDLMITGGRVADGTGNPWFWADIGIKNGKIVAVGKLEGADASRVIDARGRVVAPGFIDIHSHADFIFPLSRHPELLAPFIRQGITTLVVGNCGLSPVPCNPATLHFLKDYTAFLQADELSWQWSSVAEYLDLLASQGVALNVVPLVSHGAIRIAVLGFESRDPTGPELGQMRALVEQSMEEGAFGLSAGLIYAPGMFSTTDELIALTEPVARYDGVFTCHVRGSSETLLSSTKEVLKIGEATGARVQHSHMEAFGKDHWPKIEDVLWLHEQARARGVDAGFDVIPYVAANTTLTAILPPWAFVGGVDMLLERLASARTRPEIKRDIDEVVPGWPPWLPGAWPHNLVGATGWDNIWIIWVESNQNKHLEGKSLAQIGRELNKSPFDAAADIIVEEKGQAMGLYFGVSGDLETEEGLRCLLAHPAASINTDAILTGRGIPHPAAYGAFPRVLGHYARDLGLMRMEEAVRKMTSLAAQRFRLKWRGLIREDYAADITVFDEATVADRATYLDPRQDPIGIDAVIINGQVVLERGVLDLSAFAGRVLRCNG